MDWLNKLERRFGRYAIQNLPLYIVGLYAIGIMINLMTGGNAQMILGLCPAKVLYEHEFWRIITFLIVPPPTSLIFVIFMLLFYYSIGQSLVSVWGAFRFNMYMLIGVVATIFATFAAYFVLRLSIPEMYLQYFSINNSYYLSLSMFLAYAAIFPDMNVYLYGLLPIKVKWLGLLDVAFLVYSFLTTGLGGKIAIVVSLLNFLLFFFSTRNYKKISPKEVQRKRNFKKQVSNASVSNGKASRHKCAICGRTEQDHPELQFRYCSKCEGLYEYCNDHIFTHTHVKIGEKQ